MGAAGSRWCRGAAADLAHSEQLAREDIRLARQAEAEIQEAARTMRKARAYFSMGVTLSTAGAESQVAEADQLYRSQNYEQAIRTAAAAIQQVRQAQASRPSRRSGGRCRSTRTGSGTPPARRRAGHQPGRRRGRRGRAQPARS